jgi:hypothetical protein
MFHCSSGFFKKALKNRKNQKQETLQISNSTIVLQVDEVKYSNQNQTLLALLYDGKYILVVNIELSADQFTNSKFRIQSKHKYLSAGSIIILHSYTFKVISLAGRESDFDLLTVLDYSIIGAIENFSSDIKRIETVPALSNIEPSDVGSILDLELKEKNQSLFSSKVSELECMKNVNFIKLNGIYSIKDGGIITTIGIISLIDDIKEITPRNKNPIKIRNFFITDYSMSRVKVALWGKQAEEFCYKLGNILIFYNVKITYLYSEIALSVQKATKIEIC